MGRLRLRYEVRIDPLFSDRGIANLVVSKLAVTRKLPSKLLALTLSEVNFILLTWPYSCAWRAVTACNEFAVLHL